MPLLRIQVTTKVTVTHQFYADEVLTDAAGSVTATVKRLDGTDAGSGTATHDSLGTYSWALTPSSQVDIWTVDWSGSIGGTTVTARDTVEIVGGFLFGPTEARTELGLSATSPTNVRLVAKRIEVEQECERICRQAFVPRFARETLSGNDTQFLGCGNQMIRRVRAVTVAGTVWTSPQIATIGITDNGLLVQPTGSTWPGGQDNIVVEYEYGLDYPPEEIRSAAITRLGSKLGARNSGIPDRASSFTVADGGTYRLTLPGLQSTGIPDVDAAYQRWTRYRRAVTA